MFQRQPNSEAESKIEMIELKNGGVVDKTRLITIMLNLELLIETNPIAFYELVQICKNPEHEMFGTTHEELAKLALISSNGVHPTTKDIVLSAVEGEDLNMSLGNPVAPRSSISHKM